MEQLLKFLNMLEEKKIYYRLNKVREEAVMVEIAVPGERWEVEFMENGSIELEKFVMCDGVSSCSDIDHCKELDELFDECSD